MEKGWERELQVELQPDELERMLSPAFPGRQLAEAALLTKGLANTNIRFRLEGDAAAYVLRINTREPEAARREQALMSHIAAHAGPAIPVAPLVYSHPWDEQGYAYSIWGFVDGVLLEDLFETLPPSQLVDIAAECGTVLAAIASRRRFERCGELGPGLAVGREYGPPSAFVPSMIERGLFAGRAGRRLGTALRDELWRVVERVLPMLGAIDDRYALVHADYKRSNILMRRSGPGWAVAAVLDWEFSFAGPPIVDVGVFLRAGEALPDGFREAFAASYRAAGGELPPDWLPLSRLVDLVNQIIFLDDPRDRPQVFAETTAVVQETLRLLASLA